MVLQQSHGRHAAPSSATGIDFNRILGLSGTLALNILVLGLLLVPSALPEPPAIEQPPPGLTIVDVVPVRPKPPEPAPVVQPDRPRPTPAVGRPRIETPPAVEQAVVDDGTLPADPTAGTAITAEAEAASAPAAGPAHGMRLEYARTPAPAYPPDAARRGLEGVVMLQVLVDVDGRPLEVHIHRSSGHRILDQAAARHVLRHWTFRPAVKDGVPVQAIGIVPIEFTLRSM